MFDWLKVFLDTEMLNPHGICLLWRPELIATHAISDLLIGLAYFSIPLALGVFLYHRRDVRFGWAIWMFVGFIMLCGVTHFMMIWTLWNPDYGVEALIKAATAAVSLVTAVALWPLLPKAIALPSATVLAAKVAERDAALGELQAAMASMVRMEEHQTELARMLAETEAAEARFRSVFDHAAVGIARVGVDGRFLEVNARFAEIAGWSEAALLEGGFQRITHPDDLDVDLAHVQTLLAGEASRYSMEKRYIRDGGDFVWIRLTASLARDAAGAPDHFVAVIEDITEEKRSHETRELLMREVDHRARNALAVVQSVVRLTDASDPGVFKQKVVGRVDVLARAQASLSRSKWDGAEVKAVVEDELASVAPSSAQWSAEGESLQLPPEQVQPFSMIVHELATNATKHGALSRETGRVSVRWAAKDGRYRLVWEETGGPAVAAPSRAGFGSRLLSRLSAELEGAIAFSWAAEGLRAELSWKGGGALVPGASAKAIFDPKAGPAA